MKVFFATMILATGVFGLILSFDLLMGVDLKGIVWKILNPFRVMEPAEYVITMFFFLAFLVKSVKSYIKKKKKSQTN